jgi:hypothetical protein
VEWGRIGPCFCLEKTDFQAAIAGTLHAAEFPGKAGKAFESLGGVGHCGQAFQFFGEFHDEALLKVRIELGGLLLRVALLTFRRQFAKARAAFFFPQPILETAAPPFRQVVFGDRAAGEALGKDVFHIRQCVQPGDEVFAERAVVEAAI